MNSEIMDTGEVEKIPELGTVDSKFKCWHSFEVVFGADTFLRYCKLCGKAHTMRKIADGRWLQAWESVQEESE